MLKYFNGYDELSKTVTFYGNPYINLLKEKADKT